MRNGSIGHKLSISALIICLASLIGLPGCGGNGSEEGATSGPDWSAPSNPTAAAFHSEAAVDLDTARIDISSVDEGYVAVSAQNSARLKFQVVNGDMAYNYDLPGDGTPIVCPLNMGSGTYSFRVMQNTTGQSYIEIASTTAQANYDEGEPFLCCNVFCNYTEESACVKEARRLTADAKNQGDAVRAIYTYIVNTIDYDNQKAESVATVTGYVPNPDQTLSSKKGICFDYASLAAAMFRSIGIPCKIITGYVSPDDIYHAWNMVYIDGEWKTAHFAVKPNEWTRVDLTFAAGSGDTDFIGDGSNYTDRYTY